MEERQNIWKQSDNKYKDLLLRNQETEKKIEDVEIKMQNLENETKELKEIITSVREERKHKWNNLILASVIIMVFFALSHVNVSEKKLLYLP